MPDDADGRVEIRPRSTPPMQTWKALTYRSLQFQKATKGDARGKRYCKVARSRSRPPAAPRTIRAAPAPRTSSGATSGATSQLVRGLQGRMRTKERVRSTRGTDGNTLVILVRPDDHAMMIRLYFAMKVWVLKEGIELQ